MAELCVCAVSAESRQFRCWSASLARVLQCRYRRSTRNCYSHVTNGAKHQFRTSSSTYVLDVPGQPMLHLEPGAFFAVPVFRIAVQILIGVFVA